MTIFRYELRQLRGYTLWWGVVCGVSIYCMLPVYVGLLSGGVQLLGALDNNPVFALLGVEPAIMTQPIGIFGFLTSFFALAAGINGMYLGLHAFSKETVGRSAEFLYTKPWGRGCIYWSKLAAGVVSAAVTGLCYALGALASGVTAIPQLDVGVFLLVAFSFLWIELFFVLFGGLVGALHPKVRTPLLFSSGTVFFFYVLATFSTKVQADALKFLTPFAYFTPTSVIRGGSYPLPYLAAFVLLSVLFAAAGALAFYKRDVTLIS